MLKFYQTIQISNSSQGTLNYKRIYNCPLNCCRKNVETAVVYNAFSIGCTWSDLIKKGRRANQKFAYPTFGIRGMTSMVALYRTLVLLFEWLPSMLCDTILGLVGAKKRYNELKIYDILNFYSSRTVECTKTILVTWTLIRNLIVISQFLPNFDGDAFCVNLFKSDKETRINEQTS